jgi:hypothetical protein
MASIYGGEPDPFAHLLVTENDTKSKLARFDIIDETIVMGY